MCGVGFICHIKGHGNHKIVSDARSILCNMTHRGATGADARDGDGAGVMTGIPDEFFRREAPHSFDAKLPAEGTYAVGNVFLSPTNYAEQQAVFEEVAALLGLRTLGWRLVPTDNSILGPAAKSKEPRIMQPFVVLQKHYGDGLESADGPFDERHFLRQLYVLRKQASHKNSQFYICSLTPSNIVYKGQLSPVQVYNYFHDLNHALYSSHFALVHSRFSTNTFPSWDRAQPMRWAAHNGEINTVRGNKNWMRAREGHLKSEKFGNELELLYPIVEEGGSDSAAFDNVLELLVVNGVLTLPEAVMMMVPEAWQNNDLMEPEKKGFYAWAGSMMEPWDGPALFTFSDGRFCGANLDRNGLRPCRYIVTHDDIMICASEVGTIAIDPSTIIQKGRLKPGRMLLVDTKEGRIVDDRELKLSVARRQPFQAWFESQVIELPEVVRRVQRFEDISVKLDSASLASDPKVLAFGFTLEQLSMLIMPMVNEGHEALGSMGNDAALACVSNTARSIYDYFRQLFAQVTNPPIDPIREAIVMSLETMVGPEGNLLEMRATQCHRLHLKSPILTLEEMSAIKNIKASTADWSTKTIDITFDKSEGLPGFHAALERVRSEALDAVNAGYKIAVLSDRNTGPDRVPLSALLATGGVHHYLVGQKKRSDIAIMVDTAEAREVHHMCVLVGYGADAICPWLMMEMIHKIEREGMAKDDQSAETLIDNYRKAINEGMLKVLSKMGVSTLASYKGAQLFEALGIHKEVVDECFVGTASRIQGATFELLAMDAFEYHERAWPTRSTVRIPGLPESGEYHYRNGSEKRINDPASVASLQDAVRQKNQAAYDAYSKNSYESVKAATLRGMLEFDYDKAQSVPIDQVEPWNEIVRRCVTGAMSYGSISMEAHTTLAIAMNRLGGKSNTGEGGEDAERSVPIPGPGQGMEGTPYRHSMELQPEWDSRRSSIKQVASGRFGVTSNYLADSDELQIKMAQGAKPGEGGELPGHKVSASIGRTRHSTPGVTLVSPPPHHDIYSIEDLKQLIYDLKCANPRARVSVKLVSEVGVGVVASGVAKAKADHIVISGHDGGTGAAKWTSIKYAGLPWELGVAETHQTLVLNDLRGRVTVQTDGQIRTGRDIAIATLLGAEEWGFATTPLIAMGCIMMKACHKNTCPVGIATQDPELRAKFAGQPEQVINFFYYVIEELRAIMAKLGIRTINEMVGRADLLKVDESLRTPKTAHLDLSPITSPAKALREGVATYRVRPQDHRLYVRLDNKFIDEAEPALSKGLPVEIDCDVVNTDRALGATLSYHVSKRYGEAGLPRDTIRINMKGSAGQSMGAFLAPGVTIELEGDANDYVGKGLSGGRIIAYPSKKAPFKAEENIIIGNVCFFGATSGQAFISGIAAERFAVRNSGATLVVEGTGDHGCEYMTGGRVVVLGLTGRNFAAGMSGGIAYVLDMSHSFAPKVNMGTVELGKVSDPHEIAELRSLIEEHRHYTGSEIADRVLRNFHHFLPMFVRIMPLDYKRVLEEQAAAAAAEKMKLSHIDLVPSTTASQVDLAATGFDPVLPGKMAQLRVAQEDATTPNSPRFEPAVLDMEDAMIDEDAFKARAAKLDKVRGFMKYKRLNEAYRPPRKRVKDWKEISNRLSEAELKQQTARCMDCGLPFCTATDAGTAGGCPISNVIPKFNTLVFEGKWKEAWERLMLTNNFPEITGRVCPAPCESSCVLGINEQPVGIKSVEAAIIDKAWEMGWMKPQPPPQRTGKKVAVIGSGPAGLSAADQLNKAGHLVTIYERADAPGGLAMYGIPNMKLDKAVLKRRLDLMAAEGVKFVCGVEVGKDIDAKELQAQYDATIVATGATWPRDMKIPGREADDVHFAMEYLHKNTKSLIESNLNDEAFVSAKGKDVIVIGGGDTGNDCIGTAMRHGAKSIKNFELLPEPPAQRAPNNPWPQYARIKRSDYGHLEVAAYTQKDPREYCITTKSFDLDDNGKLKGLTTKRVEWTQVSGQWRMEEIPGSEEHWPCQKVFLALGFLGSEKTLSENLGFKLDARTNIVTKGFETTVPGVFGCGDARRGQSLIVHGINDGRKCAEEVDAFLMGSTRLPHQGGIPVRDWIPPKIVKCSHDHGKPPTSGNASDSDSGVEPDVSKSGDSADSSADSDADSEPALVIDEADAIKIEVQEHGL